MEKVKLNCVGADVSVFSLSKGNLSRLKEGMFWYEDDTVSFAQIAGKKVKAVIELIEGHKIYGDLTASQLYDIQEKCLNWDDAKRYFEKFSYPCKENENIVWYTIKQLQKVFKTYGEVRNAFNVLRKKSRMDLTWSSSFYHFEHKRVYCMGFVSGYCFDIKCSYAKGCVRPVLEFELQ